MTCPHVMKAMLLLSALPFGFAGCGTTAASDGDGGNTALDDGGNLLSDGNIADAESCGAQTEEIPLREINDPPDLLIVLDKSGSMFLPPDSSPSENPSGV